MNPIYHIKLQNNFFLHYHYLHVICEKQYERRAKNSGGNAGQTEALGFTNQSRFRCSTQIRFLVFC
jgi:hypothetical protein